MGSHPQMKELCAATPVVVIEWRNRGQSSLLLHDTPAGPPLPKWETEGVALGMELAPELHSYWQLRFRSSSTRFFLQSVYVDYNLRTWGDTRASSNS